MEPIRGEEAAAALTAFVGGTTYLHLETTAGAYTEGGFGAFIRNAELRLRGAGLRATGGRWRAGMETETGWVYAEGLTHWEQGPEDQLLLAGYDDQGRVTVVCELGRRPFASLREPVAIQPHARTDGSDTSGLGVHAPSAERAILVVLAHPDDETFACGGTIALYTHAGVTVTCACATRGEMGRQMGNPPFATRESLRELRVDELTRACAELGVRDLRLLGCWDKTTEFMDPAVLADRIFAILAEVDPSLVITHHPEHGGHPDHCAVGTATLIALRRLPSDARPRVHVLVPPRIADPLGIRLETVDVARTLDAKMAALRAHRSQSEAMLKRLAADDQEKRRRQFATERYLRYPLAGEQTVSTDAE